LGASRQDLVVPFGASADLARRLQAPGRRVELIAFETGDHVHFQDWPAFEARIARALRTSD
jgi:pimeloyl-ACP methyl ester carboxylesterase